MHRVIQGCWLAVCAIACIGPANVLAGPLPTSGLVLGLAADSGVGTTAGQVTSWNDENTGTQRIASTAGTPTLSAGVLFPNGTTHNVVSFDGVSAGLVLNNAPAFSLQRLNIFVVADTTANQTQGEFVTNYHNNGASNGWAVGNSDSNSGQLKWFTGPDGSDVLGGTTGLTVTPNTYYRIQMTADPATGKTAGTYDGTTSAGASEATYRSGANSIPYDGSESPAIGFLNAFGGAQFLKGNIAEVLVYDTTGLTSAQIAAQTASVNSYLDGRYFATPEPSSLVLLGLAAVAASACGLRRRRSGGAV